MRVFILLICLSILIVFCNTENVSAQCSNGADTAIFVTSHCAPSTVEFICCVKNAAYCIWELPTDSVKALSTFYTFNFGGTYVINGIVTLNDSTQQIISATVTIHNKPIACYTISPLSGCAPVTINYDASCTSGGQPPYKYFWDFEDGDTSAFKNGSYTYLGKPGKQICYKPLLIVTDNFGCRADTVVKEDSVCVEPKPTACFKISNGGPKCTPPDTVCFTNCSAGITSLTYSWSFPGAVITSSTDKTPPCAAYTQKGTYSPSLTVTDLNGCTTSYIAMNSINVGDTSTIFTAYDTTASCPPFTVNFLLSPGDSAISYLWDFGDGGPASTLRNPTHTYTSAGSFTVTETDTLKGGCVAKEVKEHYINIGGPTSDFYFIDSLVCQGDSICLNNISKGGVKYEWLITDTAGNQIFSSSQKCLVSPFCPGCILLKDPGMYIFTLVVIDIQGCAQILVKKVRVDICTAIEDIDNNSLRIYPNPANDILIVELSSMIFNNESILIRDVLGRILLEQNITGKLTRTNISSLASGIYIIDIKSPKHFIGKFIKENN